jgi:hypothetical protein
LMFVLSIATPLSTLLCFEPSTASVTGTRMLNYGK